MPERAGPMGVDGKGGGRELAVASGGPETQSRRHDQFAKAESFGSTALHLWQHKHCNP
jgi:hypothetical protein